MHNFPPHLSFIATLSENILAGEINTLWCFPVSVWLWKDHGMIRPTASEFQYSVKFKVLNYVSAMQLCDRTKGHQQVHILCSMHNVSCFLDACQPNWCRSFSQPWNTLLILNLIWKYANF